MKNGVYAVNFAVMNNQGGGVITLQNGRITGGDAGFAYIGQFDDSSDQLSAKLRITQHDPAAVNVFAGLTDFELNLKGQPTANDTASLIGTTPSAPGFELHVAMRPVLLD